MLGAYAVNPFRRDADALIVLESVRLSGEPIRRAAEKERRKPRKGRAALVPPKP